MAVPEGKTRVFASVGVGSLRPRAWGDVAADHPMLDSWLAQRLVSLRGPGGEDAPDELPQTCCGSR